MKTPTAALLLVLALAPISRGENEYTVSWVYETFNTVYRPQRVILDLSTDNGTSFPFRIAYGLPSHIGTNTYIFSLPDDPSLLADQAKIRLQEMPYEGEVADSEGFYIGTDFSDASFSIAGISIVAPSNGATVRVGQSTTVKWVAMHAGNDVLIGLSTNKGSSYERIRINDCVTGTNTWIWTPTGESKEGVGPKRMVIQSASDERCAGIQDFWVAP